MIKNHSIKIVNHVPQECEKAADRGYYLVVAAIDIMESTFGDRETHEKVIGRKNTYYVPPDQINLIFYLLYEAADNVKAMRDRILCD